MKKVKETLKKMCELTGNVWKYRINHSNFLCEAIIDTDISSPIDDDGSVYKISIVYDCKTYDYNYSNYHYDRTGIRFYDGDIKNWKVLRVKNRIIEWKRCPKIDLENPQNAQEYINLIRNEMSKKIMPYDKKYKERLQEKKLLNIEFEDFIVKMNELAEKEQVDFCQDPVKLKCWYLRNKTIKIYSTEDKKNWIVNIYQYGYTKYICQTLDEVYKVCEWYFSCPVKNIM